MRVTNAVAPLALQAATRLFPAASFLQVLRRSMHDDCAMAALNEEAFCRGVRAYEELSVPATLQS